MALNDEDMQSTSIRFLRTETRLIVGLLEQRRAELGGRNYSEASTMECMEVSGEMRALDELVDKINKAWAKRDKR
jgi:hypothetical protein